MHKLNSTQNKKILWQILILLRNSMKIQLIFCLYDKSIISIFKCFENQICYIDVNPKSAAKNKMFLGKYMYICMCIVLVGIPTYVLLVHKHILLYYVF